MDIHTYLGQVNHEPFDIILADLFDDDSSIDVWSEELVQLCYENLSEQGFLIINLLPHNPAAFTRLVNHIRNTFSKLTFCMTVPEHDNVLVFATRSKSGIACSEELPQKAALLEKKYPLEMALYCDNILTTNASSPLFSHHR